MTKEVVAQLKFEPREWQKRCIEIQKRFTVLAVHRRAGKTTFAVYELVNKAIDTVGLYAYIAPELKQARIIAWDSMKEMIKPFLKIAIGNGKYASAVDVHETEPYLQFSNGSKIMLFGADKPDRARGVKLAGCVIDEVAQMPREMWSEIVRPALMDSHGWALFIGTPKGINLFSDLFTKAEKDSDEWVAAKFTCYETDALDPKEIANYKSEVSDEEFKREMLCDFSASASNQLISLHQAQLATQTQIDRQQIARMPLLLGVDVGRFGNDPSVLMFRQGIVAEEPIIYKNLDAMTLASAVKTQVLKRKPYAVFVDGTGVGGGVVDILRSFGVQCYDINFTSRSNDPKCVNKRTEMWVRMGEWLQHASIPDMPQLIEELAMPTYEIDERSVKVLESKTKIKQRLGRSPDIADALALTFAEDLPVEDLANLAVQQFQQKQQVPTVVEAFNPYEQFIRDIRARRNSYYSRPFGR